MAFWQRYTKQKPGAAVSARTLRTIAEQADWVSQIMVSPPLSIMGTANGPLIRYDGPVFEAWIGITSTAITARSSSTPGVGQVSLKTWNGAVLQSLAVPAVTAYNISAASAGIPSGKYVILLRISGAYWVVYSEC